MTRNNGSIRHDEAYSTRGDRGETSKLLPFMLGAIVGGVVGATLALLYAPAEGSDLRRGVSEKLDDLTQGAKDIIRGERTPPKNYSAMCWNPRTKMSLRCWAAPVPAPTIL